MGFNGQKVTISDEDMDNSSSIRMLCGCISDLMSRLRNPNFRKRARYASQYKRQRIDNNLIVYESFFGRGMLCNPYAIFLSLLNDPRATRMKHVWVLDDLNKHHALIEKYKTYSNVSFVEYQSNSYLKVLCSAKYLINNVTFPSFFTKKENQIYINTWHGIPLKTLGYDMPDGNKEVANTVRNFLQTDYLISASPFLTEIYRTAFKLDGVFPGRIIEEGYPRLDILFRFSREEVFADLRNCGVEVDPGKKILLYAPTWRGQTYLNASQDISGYFEFKKKLEHCIDTSEYQILIKVHQRVYELCREELKGNFFVPATIDANEILSVADVLVTDFSSIYFDYLATGRPVLFYIPDLEEYRQQRNMYKDVDQLPGPVATSLTDLSEFVNNINYVASNWEKKYQQESILSGADSSGQIAARVVNAIFFGESERITFTLPSTKKKILFIQGELLLNGIGSSLLNLLHNIDYDKFDVSLMVAKSRQKDGQKRMDDLPTQVRVLFRTGTYNMTYSEFLGHRYRSKFGFKRCDYPAYYREFVRSFGKANYDYVLSFEGYNQFFSLMALQHPSAKSGIWLHNDMLSEYMTRFPYLGIVFTLYRHFDYLISCSKAIMEVNQSKLAKRYGLSSKKFRYAKNCMDSERVSAALAIDPLVQFRGKQYISTKETTAYGRTVAQFLPCYSKHDDKGQEMFRFATVGRLSLEKNQFNLVEAFDKLHQENPNTVLYIIGDGPERNALRKTVRNLASESAIIMSLNIPNPFAVLKHCDCFILPSLHEGQPMVILEARALNMPIIVSNFSSVEGVLIDNGQLVIGTGVNDIYEGLKAFTKGEVPSGYDFDMTKYNEEAYQEFLSAIED